MFAVKPHLLVVDDDPRLRDLLQRFIADKGFYVTAAADAAEARQLMALFQYEALIVDVMMPGESGLDFVRWVRTHSSVPVLMLSALGEADQRIEGLEQGADDYLPKPFEPKELLLRLERLIQRAQPVVAKDRKIIFGPYVFNVETKTLTQQGEPVYLTAAEGTLLALLISREGEGQSRDALFAALGTGGNDRTIDVQITRLRKKIEPNPKQPRYIRTLRGAGYAFFSR